MDFRFFQKRDGTKILQSKVGGSTWKNVPLVKEQSLLDMVAEAIYLYESRNVDKPCGVMLGFVDYIHFELAMGEKEYTRARLPGAQMTVMGIPVTKHPKQPHGIFLLQEFK